MKGAAGIAFHAVQAGAADGRQWVQLLPTGTFTGIDGRGPYVLDNATIVISRSLQGGRKLPVDVNHAIDLQGKDGKESPAVGWIVALESRADGVWGLVEWTPEGERLMDGRSYGFVSPVFNHTKTTPHRVEQLLRASLTNDPNLKMAALHAAQKGQAMEHAEFMTRLRAAFGLGDDADETAVLDKIGETASAHAVDPAKYVPFALFEETAKELRRVNSGVTLQAAERAVEAAIEDMRLLPFMREWGITLCTANKPAFDSFVGSMGKYVASTFAPSGLDKRYGREMAGHQAEPDEVSRNLGLSTDDLARYAPKDQH